MAPEIAFSYIIGLVPSSAMCTWHYSRVRIDHQSEKLKILQQNLKKMGVQWSLAQERLVPLSEFSAEKDWLQHRHSLLILSLLMFFMSWFGFFFHLLLYISMRKIAVSRTHRFLFENKIAEELLGETELNEIQEYLKQMNAIILNQNSNY